MAGSSFGTIFRLTTWGESHGKGVGVVVDGVPAGLSLSEEDIQFYLDLRTNLTFSLFPKIQHKVSAAHKYQYTKIFIKFTISCLHICHLLI